MRADRQNSSVKILDAVTATGAGSSAPMWGARHAFQATGLTVSGSGSAIVAVQVSNDNVNWLTAGTITLTLSSSATTDGFVIDAGWRYVRGNVTAISGTGANTTLWVGP